jgi:hypothetical protein
MGYSCADCVPDGVSILPARRFVRLTRRIIWLRTPLNIPFAVIGSDEMCMDPPGRLCHHRHALVYQSRYSRVRRESLTQGSSDNSSRCLNYVTDWVVSSSCVWRVDELRRQYLSGCYHLILLPSHNCGTADAIRSTAATIDDLSTPETVRLRT